MGLSSEEIARVKAEYEERQKKRVEKAKEKEKEKEADKDGKADQEKDVKGDRKSSTPATKSPPSSSASPLSAPTTPTHQRYTLHRDIFALRIAEHRRRRQATQAKELAPRLPGAPVTPLP